MNIWKSYMWTAEWRTIWRKIIAVVYVTYAVAKRRPEKIIYIYIYSNNSSLRNSHIYIYDFQVSIYNFIIILSRVHHEPIQRPAPSWLVSLIGRALHRYRRGQGFESRTSLNFFQAFFSSFLFCPYLGVSNTPYLSSDVKVLHLLLVVRDRVIQCVTVGCGLHVDCVCWVVAEDLIGEQVYHFLF